MKKLPGYLSIDKLKSANGPIYVIREVVTLDGKFIEWEEKFSTIESADQFAKKVLFGAQS